MLFIGLGLIFIVISAALPQKLIKKD